MDAVVPGNAQKDAGEQHEEQVYLAPFHENGPPRQATGLNTGSEDTEGRVPRNQSTSSARPAVRRMIAATVP